MKNVFSLDKAKILTDCSQELYGDKMLLLYVLCGTVKITGCGDGTLLCADTVFVASPSDGCSVQATADDRAILISVSGELVKSLSELYGINGDLTAKAPETIELFEEMLQFGCDTRDFDTERSKRAAYAFHKLMLRLGSTPRVYQGVKTAARIKEYLDTHVESKTDLSLLSKTFFMSKTQIYRLFKDEYGVSPIKYLTMRRIELSERLLKNEDLKLSEIAESLSFFDAKQFSKAFSKYKGIPPSEYRKRGCKS